MGYETDLNVYKQKPHECGAECLRLAVNNLVQYTEII